VLRDGTRPRDNGFFAGGRVTRNLARVAESARSQLVFVC
jgi:hypothetical protein